VALRKERIDQEAKDQTILKILKAKDAHIAELEAKLSSAEDEYNELLAAFNDIKKRNKLLEESLNSQASVMNQL
jgi:molecular chaperone GrpE (heat shock protein)